MTRDVDRTQWYEMGPGRWVRIPPRACPVCEAPWSVLGPKRPQDTFVTCSCTPGERHHVAWDCRTCHAITALGCTDTSAWAASTVPIGAARAAVS